MKTHRSGRRRRRVEGKSITGEELGKVVISKERKERPKLNQFDQHSCQEHKHIINRDSKFIPQKNYPTTMVPV